MTKLMTGPRWLLAAALAVLLGFAAIPAGVRLFARPDAPGVSAPPAGIVPSFCDGKRKPANLSFTVKDMNGRDVKLSAFKGQVILLNFWATWCGPCKVEIPGFVELYNGYRDKGFDVVGISTDDAPEQLRKFAKEMNITYPILVGSDRTDITDDAYGPMWGIPVSFLIGKDGTICHRFMGLAMKEQLEREVNVLLGS
jgi:cytochrome c biogenesis protein CcmG/thiol:disulfide interchange protein DsbE